MGEPNTVNGDISNGEVISKETVDIKLKAAIVNCQSMLCALLNNNT